MSDTMSLLLNGLRFAVDLLILFVAIGYWHGQRDKPIVPFAGQPITAGALAGLEHLAAAVKRLDDRMDHAAKKSSDTESRVTEKVGNLQMDLAALKERIAGVVDRVHAIERG